MAQEIITDKGLVKPTLSECIQTIGDALEAGLGPVNREADSVTGQWIGVEAEANAVHFEALEYLWSSRFLSTATGYALDAIGQWLGIARRAKNSTTVNAVLLGAESTTVPAGSLAGYGNYQFKLDATTVISRSRLLKGTFRITEATQTTFTARIAGIDYSYTKADTDTVTTIAAGLSAALQVLESFTVTNTGSDITLVSKNGIEGYSVSLSQGMNWTQIGSPATFTASQTGAIVVPIGGLKTPISAVSGWNGVDNLIAGATGSEREADDDYRARLIFSRTSVSGNATVSSIESRLVSEVDGVTLAHVIENHTMQEVDSMPPKSIQVVVRGGSEQAIANAVWKYKAAGIETYGTIRLTAYDSAGKPHDVQFSRPSEIALHVKVLVSLLDTEETLSANIQAAIKQGVQRYIATLGLGDDVITQRIYGYVYTNTTGIGKMNITVSADGQTYSEDNISVPESAAVTLLDNDIEVQGV
jgi:uncharacterized phage protein gp47/JayE